MKKIISTILLSFLCVFNAFSQSRKDQIITLNQKVDSLELVISNERQFTKEIVNELELKITNYKKEIQSLNAYLTEKQSIISVKNSEILLLQEKLKSALDSVNVLFQSLDSQKDTIIMLRKELYKAEKWITISNLNSFAGIWSDHCEYLNVESYYINIYKLDKSSEWVIIGGVESEFGGTIIKTEYDMLSGLFKITYVNNNDMGGDGTIQIFEFYHAGDYMSFRKFQHYPKYLKNELSHFKKCQ